ncbi:hypothetical protein OFO01_06940 [Campylobacter sp. JMF_01 NE2]|uniref:hypothetical protein n=1 Tax=unclassified Campylobacter TaxID=2593542 RepID=UPI0022E9BB72|nr:MULTISPECIES: hypothetical protein [unclassified Campylobacter]MDA3053302.1 hypothetical protein [Campylobacter sp. JMF_03 NE3]MDA3067515.1 hypothetical protein [Campylobacter sp. JMF_01 NE2]
MKKSLLFLLVVNFMYAEIVGGPEMLGQAGNGVMQSTNPQTGQTVTINPPNLTYPIDNKLKNKTPEIKQKEFQLTIDPNAVKEVRKNKQKYENLVKNTEIEYLIAPEQRILKDVDIISLHPQFISTLTFPAQIKILSMQSSIDMKQMQFQQNVLLIQPAVSFGHGNIFITYQSENKNYSMNLLVKSYDEKEGPLKISYHYSWNNDTKIDYVGVLKHYLALNGEKPLRALRKDGDHDVVILNGITYYIIRDSVNGNIDYGNQRFTISTRYEYANTSAKNKLTSDNLYPVRNLRKGN